MERTKAGEGCAREGLEGETEARPKKKLQPRTCRKFARVRVAEALPDILDCFVEKAKAGSVAHAKLLTSLGGLDGVEKPAVRKPRGKSMVALLLERLGEKPEPKDAGSVKK